MKITVGIDPGASLTKVIADVEGEKEIFFVTMSPEISEVSRETLADYRSGKGQLGSARPEDEAWVEWDGHIYLVGSFSRDFSGDAGIEELKYERAIYKTAAVVGVIIDKVSSSSTKRNLNNITLELVVLLPWNEYEDRKKFKDRLTKILADYSFRGQPLKVKLTNFLCRPEGSGLAMVRINQKGIDWFRDRTLAILMFGHRNVTALQFSGGRMVKGESPELGFMKLENKVLERTSGQKPFELSQAIFQANHFITSREDDFLSIELENTAAIKGLARSRDLEFRSSEIKNITEAITSARAEYWKELERWLDRCLPRRLDEVIICGGAGVYLKPELNKYFGVPEKYAMNRAPQPGDRPIVPVCWGADMTSEVEKAFDRLKTERHQEEALAFRLIDIFGLFTYFKAKATV
ncbi:MAG: ParM/StbA family protein [Crinalium sp.]